MLLHHSWPSQQFTITDMQESCTVTNIHPNPIRPTNFGSIPNHPHLYLSQSSSIHVPIHKNLSAPIWKPYIQYTHTFNGPFSGTTRVSQCQKVNQSGFYWSKRQWVAVASAGPYAVVKVVRRIRWHYTTTILRLRIGARLTRYRNCKFHNFTRTISRHADGISRYSIPPSVSPLLPLTICKSAPRSRQITTPARDHSVLYRLDALPATQPTASKHWRQIQ